ncbi:unnamed protein product [Closterium sp. NIES-54]
MRSSAAAGSSQGDVGGRRSSLSLMSATHMTAGGIASSYGYFKFTPDRISVTPLLVGRPDIFTWKEAIKPQLEMAGLIGFARGTVATPEEHYPDLRAEFRAVQLLTFKVISRCCLLGVQIALNSCKEYLDAGHQAWHFIESTYQVTDNLYIGQLEEQLSHIRMGEEEMATDYCNRAWQILATMRMAGVHYSTASYLTHVIKGLTSSYNLLKRLSLVPSLSTSSNDADSSAGGKGRDDKEASCSLVGVVEPTVLLAPEAGEDFQVMAAAVQANLAVVLLDSGCSHHLMGTKEVFVDLQPSGDVKHVRGFNGALQDVQGRGTVALQGEAGRQVHIPDVLYVLGVRANLLSAGQLKQNGVKLQEDGDGMLLVSAAGDVLGWASYTGLVLCTDLRPCSAKSTTPTTEVVALRAIVSVTKSTPDRLHARLAHVGINTIRSLEKHEVATGLDLKSASGTDLPCVSCVGGKLAQHTFPDQGSDADDMLAVVHVDLCGPFQVAAKDGSLYFLLPKDRKTRYVWVRPVAKKLDALQEFVQWLVVTERQTKKSMLMLCSDRGGEFIGNQFTDFVDGKGIVHNLTFPYTQQQNGMAEREMRTVVESVRTMLLLMGVQHHWWHLALRQAVWRGGKLKPKAGWGLHLGVSEESKGWELLDIADNRVVTTSDVVFYENMSLEVWKSEHGPSSGRTPTIPPTDTSTATPPLLAEGRSGASPVAPAKSIAGGRRDVQQVDVRVKLTPAGEEQTDEVQPTVVKSAKGARTRQQLTREQPAAKPTKEQSATGRLALEQSANGRSAGTLAAVLEDAEGSIAGGNEAE